MRALIVTDRLSTRGGADQHLLQVIGSLADHGWSVTVAYGHDDGTAALPPGVDALRAKGLRAAVQRDGGLAALAERLSDADVVHAQNVMNPSAIELVVRTGRAVVTVQDHRVFCPGPGRTDAAGRRCRATPSDEACRGCLPDGGYRSRLLALTSARRDALRGARRLVVLSSYMAEELDAAGLGEARVIPPWIETSHRPVEVGSGYLLGGRLVRHKGVEIALEAWRRSGTEQPLRVAGAGPLEERLLGVERLGWLDAPALRFELARARALLFAAVWQEPFGILGVEALAQGTPVVVAETGGTADWSSAGCVAVPPGDADAMAEAIRGLDADPEWAAALGAAGRDAVARAFSRARLEPLLHELYLDVARGGS